MTLPVFARGYFLVRVFQCLERSKRPVLYGSKPSSFSAWSKDFALQVRFEIDCIDLGLGDLIIGFNSTLPIRASGARRRSVYGGPFAKQFLENVHLKFPLTWLGASLFPNLCRGSVSLI